MRGSNVQNIQLKVETSKFILQIVSNSNNISTYTIIYKMFCKMFLHILSVYNNRICTAMWKLTSALPLINTVGCKFFVFVSTVIDWKGISDKIHSVLWSLCIMLYRKLWVMKRALNVNFYVAIAHFLVSFYGFEHFLWRMNFRTETFVFYSFLKYTQNFDIVPIFNATVLTFGI